MYCVDTKTRYVFNVCMDGLNKAIKHAGSQEALALLVGGGQTRISEWKRRGAVPADMVIPVAKAIGFAVTPHELRPDIYPHPEDGLPVALRQVPVAQALAQQEAP